MKKYFINIYSVLLKDKNLFNFSPWKILSYPLPSTFFKTRSIFFSSACFMSEKYKKPLLTASMFSFSGSEWKQMTRFPSALLADKKLTTNAFSPKEFILPRFTSLSLKDMRPSSWQFYFKAKKMPSNTNFPPSRHFWGTAAISLALIGIYFTQQSLKAAASEASEKNPAEDKPRLFIKNFVFQGGGPKGIAYPEALKFLKEEGCLEEVERVAGTSAGAIMAALWAVGYTPSEIGELLIKDQEKFKNFILDNDETTKALMGKLLDAVGRPSFIGKSLGVLGACVTNPRETWNLSSKLIKNQGVSSGDFFREWLEEVISSKVAELETGDVANKKNYRLLTFGDLEKLRKKAKAERKGNRYKQLYIIGALFDEKDELQSQVYSSEKPEMSNYIIVDAVRVSMSIPGIFYKASLCYRDKKGERQEIETLAKKGVDGGVRRNYPLDLFDRNRYLSEPYADKSPEEQITNPETLGFSLYANKNISLFTLFSKIRAALKSEKPPEETVKSIPRTIMIETRGVTLMDFNLPPEKIKTLSESGKKAIEDYYATEAKRLTTVRSSMREEALNINDRLLTEHRRLTNLARHVQAKNDGIPSHYDRLEPYMDPFLQGLAYLWVTGITGTEQNKLAVYSAERYRKKHFWLSWERRFGKKEPPPIIWFIKADTEDNWEVSCKELLDKLGRTLPDLASGSNPEEIKKAREKRKHMIAEIFKEVLLEYPGWLLIIDNSTLLDKSNDYVPTIIDNKGNLLVITYDATPSLSLPGAHNIDLGNKLPDDKKPVIEESKEIKDAPRTTQSSAEAIIKHSAIFSSAAIFKDESNFEPEIHNRRPLSNSR